MLPYAVPPRKPLSMPPISSMLAQVGDSRVLLPAALLLILMAKPVPTALRLRWALAIALTGAVVLASKLMFLGWGIGIRALDFTGFSGHAAMSAAFWPITFALMGAHRPRGTATGFICGIALAAAIAWSRVPAGAHSWSEIISGFVIGAVAAGWTANALRSPLAKSASHFVVIALLLGAAVPLAIPNLHTHDVVVELATWLSGRERPFHR